jgi:hypothetical protein
VRPEGLDKLKKKKNIHLIGSRTRYLPACSIVPQPSTLPEFEPGTSPNAEGANQSVSQSQLLYN